MTTVQPIERTLETTRGTGCPVHHDFLSRQKTPRSDSATAPVEVDAQGTWHVRDFRAARAILRGESRQAGFMSESVAKAGNRLGNEPVLFQEGDAHREQRKATARFFTPVTVSSAYRELMHQYTEELIGKLERKGDGDLSRIAMTLAVAVAGHVVGLTDSRLPGMWRRLEEFLSVNVAPDQSRRSFRFWLGQLRMSQSVASFYYLDVRPAIEARRREPREDVISYLLSKGYNDREILTECITYGAAGMVTTREFISMAAWHMLENRELRESYLAGDDATREKILHETLRLEPVVSRLHRRTTAPIVVQQGEQEVTIPEGSLVALYIQGTNQDEVVAGERGDLLCPARDIRQPKVGDAVMSFGDGHHRCPGAYIAIQESDIFLKRLLAIPTLRMVQPPTVTWNDLVEGYELRDFIVSVR